MIDKELANLVTRSKKIGSDQSLVVYGGGNTSAKGEVVDHLGRKRNVLWVKGSGADMQYGEAVDYPALYLEELIATYKTCRKNEVSLNDLQRKLNLGSVETVYPTSALT